MSRAERVPPHGADVWAASLRWQLRASQLQLQHAHHDGGATLLCCGNERELASSASLVERSPTPQKSPLYPSG